MEVGPEGPAGVALGPLRRLFPHAHFTRVQQRVIPAILQSNDNLVVAAPTGSGKTLLLEVAIARLFRDRLLAASQSAGLDATAAHGGACKAVYVCPIKALANEKHEHWTRLFAPLSVVLETGDQARAYTEQSGGGDGDQEDLRAVAGADIVLTTPERWDSITRRWRENAVFGIVHSVALLLLDEVHTVHEARGAALEAVVSRMKAIKQLAQQRPLRHAPSGQDTAGAAVTPPTVRLVATSATLPNVDDFAAWLHVPPHMIFTFTAADRPVPLTVKLLSFAHDSGNPFAFDRFLTFRLFRIIQQHSAGLPTMVFCASRKETVTVAQRLVQDIRDVAAQENRTAQLQASAEMTALVDQAIDRELRACLLLGIAFHNAALGVEDRRLVEELFRRQYVAVLCTTTTLALGVNLPAHLVVIKGTAFFSDGVRTSLPLSEVAQMCGRAGRPGLDTHGLALILTTAQEAQAYLPLTEGGATSVAESQLHRHMIEHVNAEVALHTIDDFASGVAWLRTTFFWTRLCKCPEHYGLRFTTTTEASAFDPALFAERLVDRVLTALCETGCIVVQSAGGVDRNAGESGTDAERVLLDRRAKVASTRLGRSMSRLYILFDTVRSFTAAAPSRETNDDGTATVATTVAAAPDVATDTPRFTLATVLALLSKSEEFGEVRLRQGDKGPLNELNKQIRYPLRHGRKGGREVREDWHKVYVLLQAPLSQLTIGDVSLRNDSVRLWTLVPRLARFLCDYASDTRGCFSLCHCSELLLRCLERRVWPDGLVLKQLDGVSETVARGLAASGYRGFDVLRGADACRLEVLCGRAPPFGLHLLRQAAALTRPCTVTLRSGVARSGAAGRRAARERHYHVSVHFDAAARCLTREAQLPPAPSSSTGAQGGTDGGKATQKRQRGRLDEGAVAPRMLLIGDTARDEVVLRRSFLPPSEEACAVQYSFTRPVSAMAGDDRFIAYLTVPHLVGADLSVVLSGDETPSECTPAATDGGNKVGDKSKSAFDAFLNDLRAIESTTTVRKRARCESAKTPAAAIKVPVKEKASAAVKHEGEDETTGMVDGTPAAETVTRTEQVADAAAATTAVAATSDASVVAMPRLSPPLAARPASRAVRLPPCRSPDPVQNVACAVHFAPTVAHRPDAAVSGLGACAESVYECHQDDHRCTVGQVAYGSHQPALLTAPPPSLPWQSPSVVYDRPPAFAATVPDSIARPLCGPAPAVSMPGFTYDASVGRQGGGVRVPCLARQGVSPYWSQPAGAHMLQRPVLTPQSAVAGPTWQMTAMPYYPLNVNATPLSNRDVACMATQYQRRQQQQPSSFCTSQPCQMTSRGGGAVWAMQRASSLCWPTSCDRPCDATFSVLPQPATARRQYMPHARPMRHGPTCERYGEADFAADASFCRPPLQNSNWW